MYCPKCNSENVVFTTKTTGSSYSLSDACCGTILLGPLGLLCGACGSQVKTKEFWVCNNCGYRFSNEKAQDKLDKVKLYKSCKKEITEDIDYYVNNYNTIQIQKKKTDDKINAMFEEYINKNRGKTLHDKNNKNVIYISDYMLKSDLKLYIKKKFLKRIVISIAMYLISLVLSNDIGDIIRALSLIVFVWAFLCLMLNINAIEDKDNKTKEKIFNIMKEDEYFNKLLSSKKKIDVEFENAESLYYKAMVVKEYEQK